MTSLTPRADIAEIALSQVGITETGGNNRGVEIQRYQKATWLKPGPWPWCAAFVDWCIFTAIAQGVQFPYGRLQPEKWRPRTAAAFELIEWAEMRGLTVLEKTARVKRNDIAILDMSHCGIVVVNASVAQNQIICVEGNTGPQGLRDSENIDGVYKKARHRNLVRAFIRLELA